MFRKLRLEMIIFLMVFCIGFQGYTQNEYTIEGVVTLAPINAIDTPVNSYMIDVRDHGAIGDGTTNDTVAILEAIATATNGTLLFPPGTYLISTNLMIDDIDVVFMKGAQLTSSAPVTITITGSLNAGLYRIFGGRVTANLARGSCLYVLPQWWGAKSNTNSTAAFNKAMKAAHKIGMVRIPAGTYIITSPLKNWPVGGFASMQSGITLQGNGTFSELRYVGSTGFCLDIGNYGAGGGSPVGNTIQDLHMSAPNITNPDDGGCIVFRGSCNNVVRVTMDDVANATCFSSQPPGQPIQNRLFQCSVYGSGRAGRAIESKGGRDHILNVTDCFFSCKEGIVTVKGIIFASGMYIYSTIQPLNMIDSGLHVVNGWFEGGTKNSYLAGARSSYKVHTSVIGATLFDIRPGAEPGFSDNTRDLFNSPDNASIRPDWGLWKNISAAAGLGKIWQQGGSMVSLVADMEAMNWQAIKLSGNWVYTRLIFRPSNSSAYYVSLPRGRYKVTLFMRDSNQSPNDCFVYIGKYYGNGWQDDDPVVLTLTSEYKPYEFEMIVDKDLVESTDYHGTRVTVWRRGIGSNAIFISHMILEYVGPDTPR